MFVWPKDSPSVPRENETILIAAGLLSPVFFSLAATTLGALGTVGALL